MNWMIDGLYGDLYRVAMGYPALRPHNEEVRRKSPAPTEPGGVARVFLGCGAHIALAFSKFYGVLPSGNSSKETGRGTA